MLERLSVAIAGLNRVPPTIPGSEGAPASWAAPNSAEVLLPPAGRPGGSIAPRIGEKASAQYGAATSPA
jgi:hypothetical protein